MDPLTHRSRPPWWARLLLVVVSVELSLQLGALGYRWWTARAQTSQVTNSSFTILCLGDSVTIGIGAESQKSYPRQLEDLLAARWPERRIRVVNAGVSGYNSSQVLHRLTGHLEEVRPDLILLLVGTNDSWSVHEVDFGSLGDLGMPWKTHLTMWLDRWLSHVRLYRLATLLRRPQRNEERIAGTSTEASAQNPYEDGNGLDPAAIQSFQRALETEPNNQQPLRVLANLYMENGQTDQAQSLYEQLVELESTDPLYYVQLGQVQLDQRNLDNAIILARTAIALDAEFAQAYQIVGEAFLWREKWDQAEANFRRAIELDPLNEKTRFLLAELYGESGRVEQVLEVWQETFRLSHSTDALAMVGRSYENPNDAQEAMRILLKEVKAISTHDPAYWRPHERLLERGMRQEVIERTLRVNLERIIHQLTTQEVSFALLTYPNFPNDHPTNNTLREVATRHPEALLIDADQALSDRFEDPDADLLSVDEWHPNARGYGLLARYVMERLDAWVFGEENGFRANTVLTNHAAPPWATVHQEQELPARLLTQLNQ